MYSFTSTIAVDISSTSEQRSESLAVDVPPWATHVSVFPPATDWGTTPAAVVELLEAGPGSNVFRSFATPVTFTDTEVPARQQAVDGGTLLRLKTTTAGGGLSVGTLEQFILVFTRRV